MRTPAPDAGQLAWADFYDALGLSTIPVRTDGSKAPVFKKWEQYCDRRPSRAERFGWFRLAGRYGIGIPGGPASGELIVLDFEVRSVFDRWFDAADPAVREKVLASPEVATPGGGVHVWTRTDGPAPAGSVYARRANKKTLIEVRGCQHQVVAPGSPTTVHTSGKPYLFSRLAWLDGGPVVRWTSAEVNAATNLMRAFNEYIRPQQVVGDRRPTTEATEDRPGSDFNRRASWEAILKPHGWRPFLATDDRVFWTRPGKPTGVSATTGYCRTEGSGDLFHVFTSSAPPFEPDTAYSRFAAYAYLEFGGDFRSAARSLYAAGYGKRVTVTIRFGGGRVE